MLCYPPKMTWGLYSLVLLLGRVFITLKPFSLEVFFKVRFFSVTFSLVVVGFHFCFVLFWFLVFILLRQIWQVVSILLSFNRTNFWFFRASPLYNLFIFNEFLLLSFFPSFCFPWLNLLFFL